MASKKKLTNVDAARSGSLRAALEVLRDTLAAQLDTTEAQIHAQLAAQYRAVLADLASLPEDRKSASERMQERAAAAIAASRTA